MQKNAAHPVYGKAAGHSKAMIAAEKCTIARFTLLAENGPRCMGYAIQLCIAAASNEPGPTVPLRRADMFWNRTAGNRTVRRRRPPVDSFVTDGYERALAGIEEHVRREVAVEYSDRLSNASQIERMRIVLEMRREIRRRITESAPSPDALY
jgi:hypothetical protein